MEGQLIHDHRAGAAGHGVDPGQQLLRVEGLGEIVVRPGVEPRHPVGDGAAGGEHQRRHGDALRPQLPHHGEAVQLGQHHVQQQIVCEVPGVVQRGLPVAHHIRDVTGFLQYVLQRVGQGYLVLHDQNVHARTLLYICV